jgi:N-acetylmuramic acid 6-phosphate etherase
MERPFERIATEQRNPRTFDLDRLSTLDLVTRINAEDHVVPDAVGRAKHEIVRAVDLIVDRMKRGGRLVFCGAGTSGRLGVLEAAECPPTFGTPPELVRAVIAGGKNSVFASKEGAEDQERAGARAVKLRESDVLVGIAASGVTPFVHGALAEARRRRAGRILVTSNRIGVPDGAADVLIAVDVGPEVIAGSTRLKAGTATKLVLNTLTVSSMVRLGKVYENLMVDLQDRSDKLHARAIRIIRTITKADDRAAAKALKSAGGSTKTAIVMLRRRVDRRRAEQLLLAAAGRLRESIE